MSDLNHDEMIEYADPSLTVDWVQFFIQDPKDLDENKHPKTLYRVHAFLKKIHVTLFDSKHFDHSISELINQEITGLLIDDLSGETVYPQALKFSLIHTGMVQPTRIIYNCSRCAGGLNLDFCHGCGATYHDDLIRAAWHFPLPQKIVDLLIHHDHQFEQDPQVAYKKEKEAAQFPIFGLEEKTHEDNYHTP